MAETKYNNNLRLKRLSQTAQPHIRYTYIYTYIQQSAMQGSNDTVDIAYCHAGQQQQQGLAQRGRLPEIDGAKSC